MINDVLELLDAALPNSTVEYDVSDDSFYVDGRHIWKEASKSISLRCMTPQQVVGLILDALNELDPERYPGQLSS